MTDKEKAEIIESYNTYVKIQEENDNDSPFCCGATLGARMVLDCLGYNFELDDEAHLVDIWKKKKHLRHKSLLKRIRDNQRKLDKKDRKK